MMATSETQSDSAERMTEPTLDQKMPESVKKFGDAFGRVFECPECGSASEGTCPDCGYTHAKHRDHNDGRGA